MGWAVRGSEQTAPMGDKVFDGDSWSINERSSKSAESAVPPCNGAVESMALSSPPSPAFIDSSSSHIPAQGRDGNAVETP